MSSSLSRVVLVFVICSCAGLFASCAAWNPWQRVDAPWDVATFHRASAARLTLRDGSVVELADPVASESEGRTRVAGVPAGNEPVSARREFDLDEVVGLEVRKLDGDRVAGNVLSGSALVILVVLVVTVLLVVASGGLPIAAG